MKHSVAAQMAKPPTHVLFSSDLWEPALEKYAEATHTTVKLFDTHLRLVFGPIHPTPLFELFDRGGYDPGLFAECARQCIAQTTERHAVTVSKAHGLAVVGTSLVLDGKVVGAAVAGYVLVDFSQLSEIQRVAKDARIDFARVWQVARQQAPVSQQRLNVNGELLQVLGDALLRENSRTRQYEHTSAELQETARAAESAHQKVLQTASVLRESEERYRNLAQHDVLTDLPNRSTLKDRLAQAISLARRNQHQLAVLFLDLDGFKHINDSLGHSIGDKLLQAVAMRLSNCVRKSDTVSRQGGDEFVILLPEVTCAADAAISAAKVIAELKKRYSIGEQDLCVTASVGISTYPDNGEDPETLIKNADTAMYHAKQDGRDNYQFFRPDMSLQAVERQSLEGQLRYALERQELLLHYQPKVNLRTRAITSVEALLRWQHPERCLLFPRQFLTIAEDTGMIVPIGQWVLREACRQTREWLVAGLIAVPVAVNISSLEFRNEKFVEGVRVALQNTNLDPRYLELELTETVLMRHAESTARALGQLKALGVRLTVDDFGTGYSSLSYLTRFPIDALKLDQSFVRDIVSGSDGVTDAIVVGAVISMGKSLKHTIIAEGVETLGQLEFLQAHGCDEGQGYYFSRPVVAQQFAKLLETSVVPRQNAIQCERH